MSDGIKSNNYGIPREEHVEQEDGVAQQPLLLGVDKQRVDNDAG